MAQGGQPIFILPEGTNRSVGRDAQRNNILAGKVLAETVRTTLGPKGMDKMLVDGLGDIVVTNDGVTILKEMDIEHPAAKMLVEVAKTQEDEVGDGTTTAVIIAGELLKKSESLLDQDIHPTIIAMGYRQAAEKAQEILDDIAIDSVDEETLIKVAEKTAYKVKKTGRPYKLEPMNPYERRIIHSALQDYSEINTYSEGEEPYRRIVISMKK